MKRIITLVLSLALITGLLMTHVSAAEPEFGLKSIKFDRLDVVIDTDGMAKDLVRRTLDELLLTFKDSETEVTLDTVVTDELLAELDATNAGIWLVAGVQEGDTVLGALMKVMLSELLTADRLAEVGEAFDNFDKIIALALAQNLANTFIGLDTDDVVYTQDDTMATLLDKVIAANDISKNGVNPYWPEYYLNLTGLAPGLAINRSDRLYRRRNNRRVISQL